MSYKEICEKYPKRIMEGRKSVEGNLLGCLFNDILLVKEYKIKNSDFVSDEGKFYFDIIKHLSDKNILEPTDTDVRLLCNDEVIETYKAYGGFKRIEQLKNIVDVKNFTGYLDELYKRNLYMGLIDDGTDLEQEISIVTPNKTISISYLDFFEVRNMDSQEIIEFMAGRILNKDSLGKNNKIKEESSEITDDFIERLLQGIELGTSFSTMGTDIDGNEIKCFPWISNHIQGFTKGKVHLLSGHTNTGKSTVLASIAMAMVHNGEKVLFCSNEMGCDDFRLNFLSLVIHRILKNSKLNRKKLKSGNLNEEEIKVVRKAQKIFNERYKDDIDIVCLYESNMETCDKYLRKYSLNKGTSCLIYDVFKLNFAKGDAGYLSLIEDSLRLETMVKQYNVIGIASMQLALSTKDKLRLGNSEISNAKGVTEILTTHITMRGLKQFEYDESSKYYVNPFKYVLNENNEWKEENLKLDKNATYRVFEIAKSRGSSTSEDDGICVLYKFYGGSGSFHEIGLCRPFSGVVNQYGANNN